MLSTEISQIFHNLFRVYIVQLYVKYRIFFMEQAHLSHTTVLFALGDIHLIYDKPQGSVLIFTVKVGMYIFKQQEK